ncbi:MAG: twin-arginine translocation signal domain-containing protein [Acidobacteria bacterium]|nr:twin-arginine translocation signal domain-containing protein [Acidobacteriota bacterium]
MIWSPSRRTFLQGLGAAACGATVRAHAQGQPSGPARLDRLDLLLYRDDAGAIRSVTTPAEWRRRRAAIASAMQDVMGPVPGSERRTPLDIQITSEVDAGTYVRRAITYASEPGSRTPAWLLVPKTALSGRASARAILCLHPTDHEIGHDVVVGLGGRPNRAYAAELAERGFVTLAPSYPLLARYQPDVRGLGYVSGTMKAIWDNMRGVDLLESLPFVRPGGVGAIGHSLGGHNAVYTAVFDERIAAVVSSCGLDLYTDYYDGNPQVWQPEKGWCQLRYMPRLLDYAGRLDAIPFDFAEMIGALAPRPCFISAPLRDSNFRWASVDRIAAAARPVYRLLGAPDGLTVIHPDADHDFPDEARQQAYALLTRALA